MTVKKSFILYLDQKELFEKLPNETAGQLIKHIFKYVNGEKSDHDDLLIDIAFSSIKQAINRDMEKWESQRKQRSEAGKKSAEKRTRESKRDSTTVNDRSTKSTTVNDRSTKSTVNVSDSVNVSVSDSKVNNKALAQQVDQSPVRYQLPLNDNSLFDVTDEQCAKWLSLYQSVNIDSEIRKMIGWLDANPSKRKTRRGILRFVNGWLSKVQDKGGSARLMSVIEQSSNSNWEKGINDIF